MLIWLLGAAVFVVIWSGLWKTQPKAAFGVLLGLLVAWILSRLLTPYVLGMTPIPVWLPPLPLAIIAPTVCRRRASATTITSMVTDMRTALIMRMAIMVTATRTAALTITTEIAAP